jgi:hypothetical protein
MFDYEPLEQLDYIDYLSFAYNYIETEVFETLEVLRWISY